MSQPPITLTANGLTVALDPDLYWLDEFDWSPVEQAVARSIGGALIIDLALKTGGRPITLKPYDDVSAWMPGATVRQLQTWEADPLLQLTLVIRGSTHQVVFRRESGQPIAARPVAFVADPVEGGFGDWYLVTLRFIEV